jgi:hypothetical protein
MNDLHAPLFCSTEIASRRRAHYARRRADDRQPAEIGRFSIHGGGHRSLWFLADIIGLFSNNVVSFSRNVVLRGRYSQRMWSQNSGCFLGQAIYVLGPLRSARRHSGAWTLLPSKRCSPRTPGTLDVPCSRPILVATMVSVCWAFLGTGRPSRSDPRPRDSKYGDSLLLLGHNSNLERLERNPNLILLS